MMESSWLWESLRDQFEIDDGSLPDIYVSYKNSDALSSAYKLLRERAATVVTEDPYFWSISQDKALPLDSVLNPAALVVSNDAQPFAVMFRGIQVQGTVIPDLGVFVFQDVLNLYYRMGPEWGPTQLTALFRLLIELSDFDQNSAINLDELVVEEVQIRFKNCWQRFNEEPR